MMFRGRILAALIAALVMVGAGLGVAHAETAPPVAVSSGVSYELIDRWDVDKLNHILTVDSPEFFSSDVAYTPAVNAVRLYRVTYPSVVPEKGNKPIMASGLLAVPETDATRFPMVSYQHGTVYLKTEVPSFPAQSGETQLMIAQFAGQGYVLIGADYFGMGTSTEPEGYGVKASLQQASFDMLLAAGSVLNQMGLSTDKLFIGGWSEGGFATMAFLERLEGAGVKVDGAATASGPADIYSLLSGLLDFPRKNDAAWVSILYVLSAFSFEDYYGVPGLARSVIAEDYYDAARRVYDRTSIEGDEVPSDLSKLIRPEYFDPQFFANSAYGRLALETQAYRWIIKTPLRNYYGEADEIVSVGLGQLVESFQKGIGGGNPMVEAISTGTTDHRGTFASAVAQWKPWFDGL